MQDVGSMIAGLKRPKLLVAAARMALPDYRRDKALRRVLACDTAPRSGEAVMALMDLERMHDDRRREQDAAYSPLRHLDVLIALIGEAQRLPNGDNQPKASASSARLLAM